MTVMVCVDDKMGMMFGSRRQSKDSAVIKRVLEQVGENKIWMNAYTAAMFENYGVSQMKVCEDFMTAASADAFCFVENVLLSAYTDKIHSIILYRWNRRYPGNRFFDLSLESFALQNRFDFSGNSHDMITEEIYTR